VQSSEHGKLQLMWRILTHIKVEGFQEVGAEEGIWNTEQEPQQTCIKISLNIFHFSAVVLWGWSNQGRWDARQHTVCINEERYEHSCCGKDSRNRTNCKTCAESGAQYYTNSKSWCRSDVWVWGQGPEVGAEPDMNLRTVQTAIISAAIPLCYLLNKLYLF